MGLRLSGSCRGRARLTDSIGIGPFRFWISKPLSKGRNGRRRTRSGWSVKL